MAEKYYISSNKYSTHERMTKNNGKVYDVRFRITALDGIKKMKKLAGYKTKALAKEGYLQFVQDHCEFVKNNPKIKKDPNKQILLVGDLVRQYMASLGNQNKFSSIYDKNNMFRIFILPKYENTPIEKLTREELTLWQDDLWNLKNSKTGDYFAYKYLSKIRSTFHAFLLWVEDRYGIPNNLKTVKKPQRRQPKTKMKFWTRDEFSRFIENVTDPTYHALFTFMFYTGRRKGELFALSPADVQPTKINFDKSLTRKTLTEATYEITSTKEEKEQVIPVCEVVQNEIKAYKPPKGRFYFGGDKPLADNTVRRRFIEYTQKAGLHQIRIHDLRHSFASLLLHNSASFMTVAFLIGDDVTQVLETYGHLYRDDVTEILSKIK
jgi:integrase